MATAETRVRRERGRRRREQVLRAALETIGANGVHATTHRAVAERAGVPASTTTYYFDSLDELIESALELFVAEELERLSSVSAGMGDLDGTPEQTIEAVAAAVAGMHEPGSPVAVAQYELYIEASRREALRPAVLRAQSAYRELALRMLQAAGVRDAEQVAPVAVALLDGLGLHNLAVPEVDREERIVRALRLLVLPLLDGERAAEQTGAV